MDKWEYKLEIHSTAIGVSLLNEAGRDGWEAVAALDHGRILLKRKIR